VKPSLGIWPGEPPLGISPGADAAIGGFGAGDGEPSLGISPPRAEEVRTPSRAIVIKKRFMVFSFEWGCKISYMGMNQSNFRKFLQGSGKDANMLAVIASSLTLA
jgi:hypothetical protein